MKENYVITHPLGVTARKVLPSAGSSVLRTWCQPTSLPQVMQNFHPTSSSLAHAGQCCTVRLWPHPGQKVTRRPSGSDPLQ